MRLYILKSECLEDMKANIKKNMDRYLNDDSPWLNSYFGLEKYRTPLNMDYDAPELIIPSAKGNYDLQNSISLFESLKGLSPALATEELFWANLCHTDYYSYMKNRWPAKEEGYSTVQSRYFYDGGRARGTARNGLSRLWWASYMTYDSTLQDPYEYTKLILNNQDEFESIIDRSLTRSKNVLFALLSVLAENDHKREDFRALMRSLNRMGGVTLLSTLDFDETKKLIKAKLNEAIETNNKPVVSGHNNQKERVSILEKIITPFIGKKTSA